MFTMASLTAQEGHPQWQQPAEQGAAHVHLGLPAAEGLASWSHTVHGDLRMSSRDSTWRQECGSQRERTEKERVTAGWYLAFMM